MTITSIMSHTVSGTTKTQPTSLTAMIAEVMALVEPTIIVEQGASPVFIYGQSYLEMALSQNIRLPQNKGQ